MSTHKYFDKICCVVLALTLILTVLFMNAESLGIHKSTSVMGYEKTLFDTTRVHTIDIIMDDWDEFIANCKSEEYYTCSVVIDSESYKNVAIRGKGNTSLSQVTNDRYSYKIEFDHYDSTNTYYGLDKLCLNNIIQDNTYMKDYLSYQIMKEMGVASPLCSFSYITVNGKDWGLYLAVEGMEESFLQRNYGKDYGELYKPDSMDMGGGRGNGGNFDIDKFINESESNSKDVNNAQRGNQAQTNNVTPPSNQSENAVTQSHNDMGDVRPNGRPDIFGEQWGIDRGQMPEGMTPPTGNTTDLGEQMPENTTPPSDGTESEADSQNTDNLQNNRPDKIGGMRNGSDDVLLKYIDDNIESYSNIFENAKTDITDSDKVRLIEALKKLSSGENISNTVDVDAVIRYFVVHNFLLNFDSYTGSMIHNYYLYENDGQLQMLPWDYNLAFGGFQSMGGATSLVNYPIDSPVSGGNISDRPMLAWIFNSEEYTEQYHKYFGEFISSYFDSGYFAEMIDKVKAIISPYIEKDPTKFCTFDEFKKGIDTLKSFCLLRAESVSAQLKGEIGSTTDTQYNSTLIDAGELQISDMGSMQNTMGDKDRPGNIPTPPNDGSAEADSSETANTEQDGFGGQMHRPDDTAPQNSKEQQIQQPQNPITTTSWITLGGTVLILAIGLIFAITFKRRK